jgi:hypothetical protein
MNCIKRGSFEKMLAVGGKLQASVWLDTCVCIYIYIYMYVCMYVCMYVYIYIYMYVCMYVCIYIYIYISFFPSNKQKRH